MQQIGQIILTFILVEKAKEEEVKKRIFEMEEFINKQEQRLQNYDKELVRRYIKQIKVFDDKFQIIFKSGIEVNIER